MTNSNSLRHRRSQAKGLISIPFPTSSSTFMFDDTQQGQEARPRFSGESLTPNDGYSGLFTSGMFPNCVPTPSPTLSSFPSPPKSQPSQGQSSNKYSHLAPPSSLTTNDNNNFNTPQRRRRSSIIHTTASSVSPKKLKSVGVDNGVERALEGVMRNLRVTITPKKYNYNGNGKLQSRWSSSTEGSSVDTHENNEDEGGLIKPRISNETSRSKLTFKSTKSTKSTKSKKEKGRKSEDTDRMDLDIPFPTNDVPEVPPVPSQMLIPTTPGRSRRMMNGLVKRLGLTPKKNKQSIPPTSIPPMPESHDPLPSPLPLPLPPSIEDPEHTIPRKSSFGTIRSALTKKSSNTTLRSMRSAAHPTHPFANIDNCTPPLPLPAGLPRPSHHDDLPDCFPSTPKGGRRTPKSSIGQPKLQPNQNLSPSHFLKELPRRAPETPKRDGSDIPRGQDGEQDGVIRFEEEHLGDIVTSPPSRDIDNPPELEKEVAVEDSLDFDKSQEIFTPISKPQPNGNGKPTQAQIVIQQTLNSLTKTQSEMLSSPFQPSGISTPTNFALSQIRDTGGKGRPNGLALNIDLTKNKSHIQLGSPLNLTNVPLNSMGTAKLRSKKSTEGLGLKTGGPLSMKNVNSVGLPAPPAPASSNENKIYSRMSRKDPLGIMKQVEQAMDGPPSGERERKLNLGTVESYFDPNLGTFGTPRYSYQTRREIPDFTVPPPPDSNHSSYTITTDGMEMEMENTNYRFEDADQQQGQSPEYYFQLERPSQDDIDIDDDDRNDDGRYGLGTGYGQDDRIKKSSDHTIHTIHTMTTGEGVEEWELERYLRDLEREEESRASSRRGEVV